MNRDSRERLLLVGQPQRSMLDFVLATKTVAAAPHVVGYLTPRSSGEQPAAPIASLELECLGSIDELQRVLYVQPVDHVLFLAPVDQSELLTEALEICRKLGVTTSFTRLDPARLIALPPRAGLALKHALDPLLAALSIVVTAPALVLIGGAVWATMGRPILFVQARGGLLGKPFRMLKFRTMKLGAEAERDELELLNEMSGPVFKMRDDPRVTRLGSFLRKSSLDELPQLFNVLAGTMSMVGPRPLPVHEQAQIHGWQRRRSSMKPGITCLWQIGGRNDVDFVDWMLLDLKYIDEWSVALDLWILLKTIPHVLLGRGAR